MASPRRLLIVSHVAHYRHAGRLYAYGPYAREIDIWADLFPEVVIASPCREEPPPGDAVAFTRANIALQPVAETGGRTPGAKLAQLLALPLLCGQLARAMRRADAIHVRCPGNLGLLGTLLAPLFSRRRVAKYAGQWNGYPGEAFTVRLQRALLRSRWWRGPVTVYGEWPDQPPQVVPFFTSVMTEEQVARAAAAAARPRRQGEPPRVLFVGRLSAAKGVEALLEALGTLKREGLALRGTIVGEGPQRVPLEARAKALGLAGEVRFTGGLPFEEVLAAYEEADVLVLASKTEGWPKAIAEAMAFGLVCIGSETGLVPQMLGEGRGLLVPPGDAEALAFALREIAARPDAYAPMRERAAAWAQRHTLEGLREALRELLEDRWGVPLERRPAAAPEGAPGR